MKKLLIFFTTALIVAQAGSLYAQGGDDPIPGIDIIIKEVNLANSGAVDDDTDRPIRKHDWSTSKRIKKVKRNGIKRATPNNSNGEEQSSQSSIGKHNRKKSPSRKIVIEKLNTGDDIFNSEKMIRTHVEKTSETCTTRGWCRRK